MGTYKKAALLKNLQNRRHKTILQCSVAGLAFPDLPLALFLGAGSLYDFVVRVLRKTFYVFQQHMPWAFVCHVYAVWHQTSVKPGIQGITNLVCSKIS